MIFDAFCRFENLSNSIVLFHLFLCVFYSWMHLLLNGAMEMYLSVGNLNLLYSKKKKNT